MKLFSTRSVQHLASNMKLDKGTCTLKQFSDGELLVRIDEDVKDQHVWVLAGTQTPAENLLELFFLCDALIRAGARLHVCITYLAYVRQIVAAPGEACTTHIIANFIKNFPMEHLYIVHPHSMALQDLLTFTPLRYTDFFCAHAAHYDAIAAPDKGAAGFANEIAQLCDKELILLSKVRPTKEQVEITAINGNVEDKRILLVDDIISTGHTISESAYALKKLGATAIAAAATHGIFSPGSYELLQQSPLENIFVTNTIAQQAHGKVTITGISPYIENIIRTQGYED
jgi:ribose-phosphate pyrophosphokinase